MQKCIHLSNYFPQGKTHEGNVDHVHREMFTMRESLSSKKGGGADKSSLLLYCPALLYEITTVRKDVVILR